MGAKRLTKHDFHRAAQLRNNQWIGTAVVKSQEKTHWRCCKGHEWEAQYASIRTGSGCPVCANVAPKTVRDYQLIGATHGLKWLAKSSPRNTHTKTEWQCNNGHVIEMTYNSIAQGCGCDICARIRQGKKRRTLTAEDFHARAQSKGVKWIGNEVTTAALKTLWQCPEGHQWLKNYAHLQGCPICSPTARLNADDYYALAEHKGYTIVDLPEGVTVNIPIKWRCEHGHEWMACYANIRRRSGCPECKGMVNGKWVSKPQLMLNELLKGEVNHRVGKYAVDIALIGDNIQIAIEYDCAYFHVPERDVVRDAYLTECGWRILRIKSGTQIPSHEQLSTALELLHAGSTYTEIVLADWQG